MEDAEFAKHMAIKAKQQIEADMEELNTQIDSLTKAKEAVSTFQKKNAISLIINRKRNKGSWLNFASNNRRI